MHPNTNANARLFAGNQTSIQAKYPLLCNEPKLGTDHLLQGCTSTIVEAQQLIHSSVHITWPKTLETARPFVLLPRERGFLTTKES